ncbi:uncharacterized protein LOC127861905 isoform X2 [Dreissena polymorpha]|uniref:uncharacterized protein LOC127861905 isoform X2 n=1 Tax=Dreissena polymorpha TaxID=45954 RepID=UPI002265301F|nr:uncharacterized protein LOC127861905 isoform X2 [Dreissena polymorpha]
MRGTIISCAIFLHLSMFLLTWGFDERDLTQYLRTNGNPSNVTYNGTILYFENQFWDQTRIVDGAYLDTKTCNCCTSFIKPAWINIDLHEPQPFHRIEIIGRSDGDFSQSQNLQISVDDGIARSGYNQTIQNLTRMFVVNATDTLQFVRSINLSSYGDHRQNELMTICEIRVLQTVVNITSQSSNYQTCYSLNALNTKQFTGSGPNDSDLCKACSATVWEIDLNPWWELDFGEMKLIREISISGRTGSSQSRNLIVFISNITIKGLRDINTKSSCLSDPCTIIFDKPRLARFINVKHEHGMNEGVLTLCQVDPYEGDCQNNTFGDQCSRTSQCATKPDVITGFCRECLPGWTSATCEIACVGRYGHNCTNSCSENCLHNSSCNHVNGECLYGCKSGYDYGSDKKCNVSCILGTYGLNCTKSCSMNCMNTSDCKNDDGSCIGGCVAGYDFSASQLCNTTCSGYFGKMCSHQCHCNNRTEVCDPFNGTCVSGCLEGWSGSNCSVDLNILRSDKYNVSVSQSSNYSTCTAERAIDGLLGTLNTTDAAFCTSCSATSNIEAPWWQIHLDRKILGLSVRVFGRKDNANMLQSQNILVYVSNETFTEDSNVTLVGEIHNPTTDDGETLSLNKTIFQYMRLRLWNASYMALCEVKLFGADCLAGHYGEYCDLQCNCLDNKDCDAVSGKCSHEGCKPGWKGDACDTRCIIGTYGQNCTESCSMNCTNTGDCKNDDGSCIGGCVAGYDYSASQLCNTTCSGYFGNMCSHQCHCNNRTEVCDSVNGTCASGCLEGWSGSNCSVDLNILRSDKYNVSVSQSSNYSTCTADRAIDGLLGTLNTTDDAFCTSCSATSNIEAPWWQIHLDRKILGLSVRVFGRKDIANMLQSQNILVYVSNETFTEDSNATLVGEIHNPTTDDGETLSLNKTIFQYMRLRRWNASYMALCEVKLFGADCLAGHYGEYCDLQCNCLDNKDCDAVSGKCSHEGCKPGWKGDACDTRCIIGTYGQNCTESCSMNCMNTGDCKNDDGSCIGGCVAGYDYSASQLCNTTCSGYFGNMCSHQCHCNNRTEVCDPFNGTCASGCLEGWSGSNCSVDLNILRSDKYNVSVSQSSNYSTCTADRAIDGLLGTLNTTDDAFCTSCSATFNIEAPWWQIHLDRKILGLSVRVFGRKDNANMLQSQNILVYVSNETFTEDSNVTLVGEIHNPTTDDGETLSLNKTIFQYMRLRRWYASYMALCEVKLFGADCLAGHYGEYCDLQCNCLDNKDCDAVSGKCSREGCKPGWKGDACDTRCIIGTYGLNCTESCSMNCMNTGDCKNDDGSCIGGCVAGYDYSASQLCNTTCSGYFGNMCSHQCHCNNRTEVCDPYNGTCVSGCLEGWSGSNCSIDLNILRSDKYNVSVSQSSNYSTCTADRAIDGLLGTVNTTDDIFCTSCSATSDTDAPWWQIQLDRKILGLSVRVFGRKGCQYYNAKILQSQNICVYISNETFSKEINGTLVGIIHDPTADDGETLSLNKIIFQYMRLRRWNASYMALCEVKLFSADCLAGHYGEYCDLQCNCLDNKRCDAVSGKCFHEGCKPGWQRDSCDTPCDNGFFGMNCSSHCHCRGGVGCDPMSGQCSDKECAPGWIGLKCSTECKRGFFGNKCQSTCRCKENAKCDHINGTCPGYLCADGWRYDNCSIECASGYYGENCSTHCHCNHCHNVNGSCSLYSTQCNDGFRLDGEFCTLADSRPTSEGAIVGGVGAAIAVIIGIAVGLFFFKRRENSKNKHHSSDSTELTDISSVHKQANATSTKAYVETDANAQVYANTESDYYSFKDEVPGIKIHLLWDYIREKTKPGSSFFENEFAKLPSGLIYPHDVAAAVENRGKNRYREMYAYDHSRVPLKKDEPNDSEYINACFINGFEKVNKFIASQGPTKKMIEDFWRMIWQQRVHKIVMLTNLIEMGTLKCMQYWPAQVKGVCTYGGVEISYADIKEMFDYNIRTFDIRRGKESRSVQQFHFKAWPDKDVPETTWCLVDFWRAVDTNDTANISPIVVHCSAGVGRTGAFIAIDSLITQARMEGSIGPLQMVEALRRQRVNMVQTKKQYQFLHEAVADAVLMGTHHVLTREFSIIFEYMMGIEEGSNTTRLEEQFNLIVQSVQEAAVLVDGQASSSQTYGNMETVMSEIDAYRPQLQERGSKFIQQLGAIFLPTFDNKNALLVCISPTDQHMEDFWSLVEEQHVTTVINMSMPCSSFKNMQLLGRNGSGKTGKFSVKYKQEKKKKGFVERSISFCDENHEDEGGLTTIKEFQLISWPERDDLPTNMQSFFDMIEEILKWQPDLTDRMPILIHCQTGYTRSGLIAVILNEIQRIKSERGQINIVESVKTMKTRCRDVIHSKVKPEARASERGLGAHPRPLLQPLLPPLVPHSCPILGWC